MTNNPSKAYDNKKFLNSHDARSIRVLCELLEPESRLSEQGVDNTIVFFGSARPKPLNIAKSELKDFISQLPRSEKRSNDEIEKLNKLESITRLSKYYDNAVDLSRMLTQWSDSNPVDENILSAQVVVQV